MPSTPPNEGWVFCPKCQNRPPKLCKKRPSGGYEMKSGDRRAVIYAGSVICPKCQFEQPIPPSPRGAVK